MTPTYTHKLGTAFATIGGVALRGVELCVTAGLRAGTAHETGDANRFNPTLARGRCLR